MPLRSLLMTRASAAKSVQTSSRECRQSFKHACLFHNGRSDTSCLLIVGILVCCGILDPGLNANPKTCALPHRGITERHLFIVWRGPAPSTPTFTLSCRPRRICHLRRGPGKRELRIFSPNLVPMCHSSCRIGCGAGGCRTCCTKSMPVHLHSLDPATLMYLSRASELNLLLDSGVQPFRCLFFRACLMLFLHFVVASGISIRFGPWTPLTCAFAGRQRTWM